jgi:hypothetical protein
MIPCCALHATEYVASGAHACVVDSPATVTVVDAETSAETPSAAIARLRRSLTAQLEQLAADVDALRRNAGFNHLLAGMARLWRYSVYNDCLIFSQFPQATAVMGRKQWQAQGRTVRADAVPICIYAPWRSGSPYPLVVVQVFDIAQTDGPDVPRPAALPDSVPQLAAIEAAALLLDIRIEDEPVRLDGSHGGVLGCAVDRHCVRIAKRLKPAWRAATLVHEYAHALLHFDEDTGKRAPGDQVWRETEAEAACHVVMTALGLATVAPMYIAWHGGSGKLLLRSLQRVNGVARAILSAIEGKRPSDRPLSR